jgi:type IV/VI secretion system ImpK/VasF family protein
MDELTEHVHRVLDHGMVLKERLARGELPDLAREQAELKNLLMAGGELRNNPDYAGEGRFDQSLAGGRSAGGPPAFRGVRYALVCWLDEIFVVDSPWSDVWNEQKLETALYGTNDRAWRFWDEARLAESRPGVAVLEAFFWCVILGFRGELRGDAAKLDNWVRNTRARLVAAQQQDWPLPAEREIPSNVPVRAQKDRYQTMIRVWAGVVLLAVPVLSFFLMKLWGR